MCVTYGTWIHTVHSSPLITSRGEGRTSPPFLGEPRGERYGAVPLVPLEYDVYFVDVPPTQRSSGLGAHHSLHPGWSGRTPSITRVCWVTTQVSDSNPQRIGANRTEHMKLYKKRWKHLFVFRQLRFTFRHLFLLRDKRWKSVKRVFMYSCFLPINNVVTKIILFNLYWIHRRLSFNH